MMVYVIDSQARIADYIKCRLELHSPPRTCNALSSRDPEPDAILGKGRVLSRCWWNQYGLLSWRQLLSFLALVNHPLLPGSAVCSFPTLCRFLIWKLTADTSIEWKARMPILLQTSGKGYMHFCSVC